MNMALKNAGHTEKLLDMPLCEAAIVHTGVGAALSGMRPMVEIQFGGFAALGFNALVNNAAIPCYGLPLDGMKPMQVYESIETNLLSPIRLTQKIYPLLKEQRHGSIININSIVGKEPKKYRSVHSATKWGLKGFTKSLRIEAEDYNVKLINVYPSQIKTVKEHTFGLEPYDVAKQIYNEHQTGKDWDELIIDGRPEEFRP